MSINEEDMGIRTEAKHSRMVWNRERMRCQSVGFRSSERLRSVFAMLCFCLLSLGAVCQDEETEDNSPKGKLNRMEAQLDTLDTPVDRCLLLVEYAHMLRWVSEMDAAMAAADSAHRMAERLDDHDCRVAVKEAYAHIYLKTGDYDKSLRYQRAELEMRLTAEKVDSEAVGILFMSIGSALQRKGLYYNALDSMDIALELIRKHGEPRSLAITLGEVFAIYSRLGEPEKGFDYLEEAIVILKDLEPHGSLPILMDNKARYLYKDGQFEEAKTCLREAEAYCDQHGYDDNIAYFRSRSGQIAVAEAKYAAAIPLFEEAIGLFEQATDTIQITENRFNLSEAYLKNGDIDEAFEWAKKLETYLDRIQDENFRADAFLHLAEVYEVKGDAGTSLDYMHRHIKAEAASDSLAEMSQARNLEARFRNDEQKIALLEKDQMLDRQQREILQKNNRLRLLAAGVSVIALLALLVFFGYRQRLKSQAQKAELSLNKALIESTEEERERIASELHDGTGSLLTGIKLNLEHLQVDLSSEDHRERLSTTITQVQRVAKEVRRVSHAMAPTAIERLPFEEVVSDLLSAFKQIDSAKIDYAGSGDFEQMNKTERLMLYRILQECLNNSFKHADAKEITISLNATADEIEMLYQDDGNGYDPSAIKDGLGLSSIEKRIRYLHGKGTLETESGRGMLMIVNFPILRA